MVKSSSILKICFVGILLGLIIFYVQYWEPYCYFKSGIYSNGISSIVQSPIIRYGSLRSFSNTKNLILILTPKISLKLLETLKLLDQNFRDNLTNDVLLLYNNAGSKEEMLFLSKSIKREIMFLDVSNAFNLFPIGFDPCHTKTSFYRRGKWNYQLMIRFWFKILFELPQLEKYEYLMRLDDDSKITNKWINLFQEIENENGVYFANDIDKDLEKWWPGTMKMKEMTWNYIQKNNITVKQPQMLNEAFGNNLILNYYNNFEITQVQFFQRKDVRHWIDFVDSTYGIFKYRWGDAVLRYLTLAIFAEKKQILHRAHYNLSYCHGC